MKVLGILFIIIVGFVVFAIVWDIFIVIASISILILPVIVGMILCVIIWMSGHDNVAVLVLLAFIVLQGAWTDFDEKNKIIPKITEKLLSMIIPLW
jgi:hypothetical protein